MGENNDRLPVHGQLDGSEYSVSVNDPFSEANVKSLKDNDVPCAVCRMISRPTMFRESCAL